MYTRETYQQILAALQRHGYHFASFEETFPSGGAGKVVYLRHDVDFSLPWALDFARINASHGVAGTFFVQLRSAHYNTLAYPSLDIIKEIASLGQHIGLHYAISADYSVDDKTLIAHIIADYQSLLSHITDLSPVFSWHNPSLAPDVLKRGLDMEVPGMVNAYSRYFFEEVKYVADSNLRYSVEEFENIINDCNPRLQLLFHPFQWMAEGRDMQQVLANCWVHLIREKETILLDNHVYRKIFPSGMPSEWLQQLAKNFYEYPNIK